MPPRAIAVRPYDLARGVDPERYGVRGTGDIEGREHPSVIEKAMVPCAIDITPHDLARGVDPEGYGVKSAGDIEGRKGKRSGLGDVVSPY
jgi:hypothetical protein